MGADRPDAGPEESRNELRRSRARLAATAERERRRIERDLHDGAQQRLVALRVELELAEDLIRRDPERAIDRIHELGAEVDGALEDIRSLARGIYPSLLADRGLPEAVQTVVLHLPATVALSSDGVSRYPAEVESAVYFSVVEALQNAVKHAGAADHITVELDEDAALCFTVRDDGTGFDPGTAESGTGLTSMRDRLAAVGGELRIVSAPGAGTTVTGRVPFGHSSR